MHTRQMRACVHTDVQWCVCVYVCVHWNMPVMCSRGTHTSEYARTRARTNTYNRTLTHKGHQPETPAQREKERASGRESNERARERRPATHRGAEAPWETNTTGHSVEHTPVA